MSECNYDYKFYFSTSTAGKAAVAKANAVEDDEAKADVLGFAEYIDENSEYLDSISVTNTFCQLSFTTSASADLNHRLIRASKDIGSEFCVVNLFNTQVGEGGCVYLYRGREVSQSQRDELLAKYVPYNKLTQAIVDGDLEYLKQAVRNGLDVNQKIDGHSLLEMALKNEQLNAFKLLLKCKANVNVPAGDEPSLLMYAVKNLDADGADFVILLVKVGADVSVCDSEGASVMWYMWRISQPLHKILLKKGAVVVPPKNAYSSDNPVYNLSEALGGGDHSNVIKYFKLSAKNRDNWEQIARDCVANDYVSPVNVLLKNGFLQGENISESLCELLTCSLESAGLESFALLFGVAEHRNIDISDYAEDFLHSLMTKKNASDLIAKLVARYPSVLTPDIFGHVVREKSTEYLTLLFNSTFPFKEYEEVEGMPVLHSLICDMSLPCLELLVAGGLDINQEYDNQNILDYCIADESVELEVKQYLLNHVKGASEKTLAFSYVNMNNLALFKDYWVILKNKAIVDDEGNSLLMVACANPESTIVPFLLSQGVDIAVKNEEDKTAFAIAFESGAINTIQLLLAQGANPDEVCVIEDGDDERDAMAAKLMGMMGLDGALDNPIVASLEKAKELSQGATYLMHAASNGDLKMVALLIEHGANIWLKDSSNQDALTYAIMNEKNACVDYFFRLDNVADAIKAQGVSLINMATLAGNDHAIKALLNIGVPVDLEVEDLAMTPLILAAVMSGYHGHCRALDALIKGGANLGKVNDAGKTALIYAATNGDETAVAMLLAAGGYPDHLDKELKTAYDHFTAHRQSAAEFDLEALRPKSKMLGVYKMLIAFRRVILKWIVPSYVILSVVAYFTQTYALYGMVLVLLFSVAKVGLEIKAASRGSDADDDEESESDNGNATKEFYARGLAAISNAMNENKQRQLENQAIIDSWDDENSRKPMEG